MTALAPHIGYTASTSLARQALATGRTIKDLTTEGGLLTDQLDEIPRPENLTPTTSGETVRCETPPSAQIVDSYPTGRIAPDLVLSAMRTAHVQLQEVIKSFLRTAGDHLNGDSAS